MHVRCDGLRDMCCKACSHSFSGRSDSAKSGRPRHSRGRPLRGLHADTHSLWCLSITPCVTMSRQFFQYRLFHMFLIFPLPPFPKSECQSRTQISGTAASFWDSAKRLVSQHRSTPAFFQGSSYATLIGPPAITIFERQPIEEG